jgi:hypothetical protein
MVGHLVGPLDAMLAMKMGKTRGSPPAEKTDLHLAARSDHRKARRTAVRLAGNLAGRSARSWAACLGKE